MKTNTATSIKKTLKDLMDGHLTPGETHEKIITEHANEIRPNFDKAYLLELLCALKDKDDPSITSIGHFLREVKKTE